VLDALESLEELLEGGAGERDDAASLSACTAAEEAVAARLVETRRWFLAGYCGESVAEPAIEDAMDRVDWTGYYPVIDGRLRLTGEWVYADEPNPTMLSYRGEVMISRDSAAEAGWTIDEDEVSAEPPVIARHESRGEEGTGWYVYVGGKDAGGPFETEAAALENWQD
jgi:hypothetical protein